MELNKSGRGVIEEGAGRDRGRSRGQEGSLFPVLQFVYDLKNAKKGHLPLTSALRGTYLL